MSSTQVALLASVVLLLGVVPLGIAAFPAAFCGQVGTPGGNIGLPLRQDGAIALPTETCAPKGESYTSQVPAWSVAFAVLGFSACLARRQRSRTMMQAWRSPKYWRLTAKGMPPPIKRKFAKDWFLRKIKQGRNGQENPPSIVDVAENFKQKVYGRMNLHFSTPFDKMPWQDPRAVDVDKREEEAANRDQHLLEDPVYVRKFLEPTPFKKLAIAKWQMPSGVKPQVQLEDLLSVGCQYGHNRGAWHPAMYKYIYAEYDGIHIFDLVQTAAGINRACYYLKDAASKGAQIVWVGTKVHARKAIQRAADLTNMPYFNSSVIGGTFTNSQKVAKNLVTLQRYEQQARGGQWDMLPPATAKRRAKKLANLARKYKSRESMVGLPHIMVVVDERKERFAVEETMGKLGIPTVALLDSTSNPKWVDFPIPCNTTSSKTIDLILGALSKSVAEGAQLYEEMLDKNEVPQIKKQWDPWAFGLYNNHRFMKNKQKRQPWHKQAYGSYEKYMECHPFRHISPMQPYHEFDW